MLSVGNPSVFSHLPRLPVAPLGSLPGLTAVPMPLTPSAGVATLPFPHNAGNGTGTAAAAAFTSSSAQLAHTSTSNALSSSPIPVEYSSRVGKMDRNVANGSTASYATGQSLIEASGGSPNADQSSSGRSSPVDAAQNKLFVGGLSWQTSAEKLREYFAQYGTITDVLVMKDPLTQRSRGFGFITFADPLSVDRVLAIPAHTLDGKKIDPKHATPKNRAKAAGGASPGSSRTKKIFVGGVSQDTSAEEVKGYFSQFGKVDEAVMLMDQQTKRHRGFGFVTFECEEVVDRVCDIHFHTIKNKRVECKKAQPKEAVLPAALMVKRTAGSAAAAAAAGVLINGLNGLTGLGLQPTTLTAQQLAAAQAQAVQVAVQQSAGLAANYGKFYSGYPALASYRFSPYSVPGTAAAAAAAAAANPAQTATLTTPTPMTNVNMAAASSPYQGYSLTNVDMSSFQGVDWNAIYGMGMYV